MFVALLLVQYYVCSHGDWYVIHPFAWLFTSFVHFPTATKFKIAGKNPKITACFSFCIPLFYSNILISSLLAC